MSCTILYKGQKYSEEQFKEYFINNKQEFATSIAKNKDVIDSFKRKMEGIDVNLYSQYLEQNPNGTVEGFKSWVDSRHNQTNNNSLFGLNTQNQEQLEFHINTLNVVSQFLENIGVETRLVPEFLSQDGSIVEGAIAAANFIEGTVDIINDLNKGRAESWNKLPEEASHWWYRLLNKNQPLKKLLWEAHQTEQKAIKLKNSQYGNTYEEFNTLKEEAIGQLIAEAIKRIETKNANAADYSFFKKFLEWINSIINAFKNTTQDPFEVAAMKILSSDMSDLMTWEEYRKLNNIVNFADVLTEQSVAPIDYTLIEDIGEFNYGTFFDDTQNKEIELISFADSPYFDNQVELDNWVNKQYGHIISQKQEQILQEVKDNQIFFDRLLNKTFRKKSKFLPKTLRKYFDIIGTQNLNPLREWNISQELQQTTKKLSEEEKRQIIETNGYTNIAPTLKVLPDLLQKYRKNPIVLSETIKIDGAKKQELSILNGVKEMIKLENPNLKSITAEEFVAEAHNWLETNYLLGFANEKSYLSYRTDRTFSYLSDRQSNEDVDITNMTEEELQRLTFEERQRIANIVGLTKQNPDVYHNKVSLRFNDMYHLKSGHFDKSPSAWGNLTYFYTGKNKWKDAVLLHEIQNDNIEFLREFKAEKVDLETSLGRYLQQLNTDLLDNITQIESGGKTIIRKDIWSTNPPKQHLQLNYQLEQLKNLPLEQGLSQLKESLNERIELYKSYNSVRNNPEKAQEAVEEAYSKRRIFQDFQKRGGIKSLLTKEELNNLKEILNRLNTGEVMTDAVYIPEEIQYEPAHPAIRNLREKKQKFKRLVKSLEIDINNKLKELYGNGVFVIKLQAPAKPRTKSQIRQGVQRSQELNENVNFLIAYSEKQISTQLSKNIEESKKNYIKARNATVANNFNVALSKITPEQYATLIENYKYNKDLLNRLIDEQVRKDVKSPKLEKIAKAKSIIEYFGDDNRVPLGKGIYGFMWNTANTDKGIVSVWNAYKAANTDEDSYEDNWSVDEFLEYVKKVAPEYLTLDTREIDINKQKSKFEALKQQALDKKAELEKNYGKIEEEVKQTLEIEMNYFTPLVHHLIQKHINQYGKDFPMYFSGYQITKLTQGNDRTALIYAGKDEIDIIPHSDITINGKNYRHDGNMKYVPLAFYIDNKQYRKINGEFSTREDGIIKNISEQEYEKARQEYEKAYQQATERRAKEIKYKAAIQIGLLPRLDNPNNTEIETAIKKLNDYKKQSKQNLDRVINTMMNISNSRPIETGAIYNAMTQISGVKLIWQDKIDGLKNNAGGYLVDLSNYNYNTPILYALNTSKVVPINPNMVDNSEIQYSKVSNKSNSEEQENNIIQYRTPTKEEIEECLKKPKAEDGAKFSKFTKGSEWEVVSDLGAPSFTKGGEWRLEGAATHNTLGSASPKIKAEKGIVISKFKPTKAKENSTSTYNAIPSAIDFDINSNNVDNIIADARRRKDVSLYDGNSYKTDYGQDENGEYISFYRKDGNMLTDLFGTSKEYYDRRYIEPRDILKLKTEGVTINDNRRINNLTGAPLKNNKKGVYGYPIIEQIIKAANKYEIDPYVAISMALQETNLGKTGAGMKNPFHIKGGIKETPENLKRYAEYFRNMKKDKGDIIDRAMNMLKNVSYKDMPKNPGNYSDEIWRIQSHNGWGYITPNTEIEYDGGGDRYEMKIPKEGVSMKKNPIYGRFIKQLKDESIAPNKDIQRLVEYFSKNSSKIIKKQKTK